MAAMRRADNTRDFQVYRALDRRNGDCALDSIRLLWPAVQRAFRLVEWRHHIRRGAAA